MFCEHKALPKIVSLEKNRLFRLFLRANLQFEVTFLELDGASFAYRLWQFLNHRKEKQQPDCRQHRSVNHTNRWTKEACDYQKDTQNKGSIKHLHTRRLLGKLKGFGREPRDLGIPHP